MIELKIHSLGLCGENNYNLFHMLGIYYQAIPNILIELSNFLKNKI